MEKKRDNFLASIAPFDILPSEEISGIGEFCLERDFAKGETIFVEGSTSDTVWIVREGRVHLGKQHHGGKFSTICVMVEGDLLCCLPAVDRKGYPATAVAKSPAKLIGIPARTFSKLITKYPAFSRRALTILGCCLRQIETTQGLHSYESAERRVVKVLLMLAEKFGPEIPLTREEIAEFAGLTVETAIRVTSRLKKAELISSNGKRSLRVDAHKLSAHLEKLSLI